MAWISTDLFWQVHNSYMRKTQCWCVELKIFTASMVNRWTEKVLAVLFVNLSSGFIGESMKHFHQFYTLQLVKHSQPFLVLKCRSVFMLMLATTYGECPPKLIVEGRWTAAPRLTSFYGVESHSFMCKTCLTTSSPHACMSASCLAHRHTRWSQNIICVLIMW